MTNFNLIFVLISFTMISVILTAEITHKLRHKGNHKKSHKTTTESPPPDSNIPPRIWALLSANSMPLSNDQESPKPNDLRLDEVAHETIKCPGCAQNSDKTISYDDLDALRIEFVKNEILNKLRLNERPPKKEKVIDELPEPVQDGHLSEGEQNDVVKSINLNTVDYYAKTTQKIVFLTNEGDKCQQPEQATNQPSICFSLQLPPELDFPAIESAQLWVFKKQNDLKHALSHTLLLSEVNTTSFKSSPISFIQTNPNNHDWEKMDITTSVKLWTENRRLEHLVRLTCDDCKSDELPISMHNDFKPFIVIDTIPPNAVSRKRRSINCSPDSKECCRDSLYIDFAAIGWNDWIIHPKGYNAYFCHGACNGVASITRANSDHAAMFNRFMHSSSANKKKLEMVPCCAATQYSPLSIIYLDSNNTGTMATLPNMIVESCGCS